MKRPVLAPATIVVLSVIGYLLFARVYAKNDTPANPPDIVVILVDDMGFSDIGSYGGEIRTPHLDTLAMNGVRFSRFYNTGRCSPTRASLMTGVYPHQAGVGVLVQKTDRPGYYGRLNEETVTIAEVLQGAGYQTFMSGKWHLTHHNYSDNDPDLHRDSWPMQRGFDRFFGTIAGAGSFYDPKSLTRGNELIQPDSGFYYTNAITVEATRYIREADADRPLFLYVAHVAPHWPLHAPEEEIRAYDGAFDMGWDEIRDRRLERQIEMGLIDPSWPLTPRDAQVAAWEDAEDKAWETRRMQVYAAQITMMDRSVGEILRTLRETGRLDNTMILFMSDNGGSSEIIQGTTPRHGTFPQGGTRPDVMPGGPETYASYGIGWANASNTPFRLFKKYAHEGGIATPLIVHWPAGIRDPGTWRDEPAHVIDVMATALDVTGAAHPTERRGLATPPVEGRSLLPILNHEPREPRTLFWEHVGNRAVLSGDWKIVATSEADTSSWELYDMRTDRTEMLDLAAEHPDVVARLSKEWEEWAKRTLVK